MGGEGWGVEEVGALAGVRPEVVSSHLNRFRLNVIGKTTLLVVLYTAYLTTSGGN